MASVATAEYDEKLTVSPGKAPATTPTFDTTCATRYPPTPPRVAKAAASATNSPAT